MIYLDNAATGFPKSDAVLRAMQEAFVSCGNPSRSSHTPARNGDRILFRCRQLLAERFGSTPENVILTKNATEALNMAIKGLYRPGGEVLTSTLEHNAVLRPLHALRIAQEITLKQFRVDPAEDAVTVENFRIAAGERADMAVVTHASNVCGRILPIPEMRKAIRREDFLLIVDASQTAGHIPVDIRALGADVLCLPGHKGLYGPMGTGALICNPDRVPYFRTLIEGGSGIDSRASGMPEVLPERLEAGTPNVYGIAGLAAALTEFRFPEREHLLYRQLLKELRSRPGIRLYGQPADLASAGRYVPVLLFNREGTDCEALGEQFAERDIAVRAGLHCAPAAHRALGTLESGGVRVSLGRSTTGADLQAFLDALQAIQ